MVKRLERVECDCYGLHAKLHHSPHAGSASTSCGFFTGTIHFWVAVQTPKQLVYSVKFDKGSHCDNMATVCMHVKLSEILP